MSKTEAKIAIREIRSALSADVALGGMTQEQADHVAKSLGLDWKEADYNKRNDMGCFLSDLKELLEKYEAIIEIKGIYATTLYINGFREHLHIDGKPINAEYAELFPKILKRQEMVSKLSFSTADHIDDVRPILDAVLKVDRKSWAYVTDKQFAEMLKPYKPKKK